MNRIRLLRSDYVALIAGALLPLAFAPFNFSLIAFISPTLLLYVWTQSTPFRAAAQGFLFGIGFFAVGVSWVFISIHVFGQAPIPLAALITFVFIGYLASFFAAMGYTFNSITDHNRVIKNLIVFPCIWVVFELLRSWLFSGFPWLLLGYSQVNMWLKAFAPFLGVYGVSFITVFISGSLLCILQSHKTMTRLILILSLAILFVCSFFLTKLHWTSPAGQPVKITMIQGNIEQDKKWQPEQVLKTLTLYSKYTLQNWSSNIIIWPEAAITLSLEEGRDFVQRLGNLASQHHSTVITGIPVVNPDSAFNAMITIGNGSGMYYKRHLVPFGEYIPLKPVFKFLLQVMHIPMSDFTSGAKKQSPLIANGIAIAPYICYEVAYPLEFLTFLPQAQLLLTVTDDSWFGHSIASSQHLQMAQMRALETGRYLLFSSNTGITAVLNPTGANIKSIPPFQEATLTTLVYPMKGQTPWMVWKLYPLLGILCLGLIILLLRSILRICRTFSEYTPI